MANGNADTMLERLREEESEGLAAKARRKAPWVITLNIVSYNNFQIVKTINIFCDELLIYR